MLAAFPASVFAEVTDPAAQFQAMQAQLQSQLQNNNSPTNPGMPPIPTLNSQPVTPPQQPQDRAKNNGSANAAAIAGAAMAGLMCVMLMKQAMEAEGSEKQMLMMMAMQQCAQAAQSAAAAGQNDKNKQQLTMDNTPKQSTLAANPFPQTSDTPKDNPSVAQNPTPQEPTPTPSETPKPEVKKDDGVVTQLGPVGPPINPFSVPAEIDAAKLKFDETAKAGSDGGSNSTSTLVGRGPASSSSAAGAADKKEDAKGATDSMRKGKSSETATSSGSDSESTSSKSGNDPFAGMLSQLMGGAGGPGGMPTMEGGDIVAFPTKAGGKPSINIFQFASRRYKTYAYTDGRVKPRAPKSFPAVQPTQASLFH